MPELGPSVPSGGGGGSSGGFNWGQLIPAIIGLGSQVIGSTMQAKASNKGPQALFPWLQSEYTGLVGGLGAESAGTMSEMIKTGMPTDVGPAFEALVASKKRFQDEGRENIAEMFGASGQRYGTPLMHQLGNYESQVSADFMSILAQYTQQAQEAARSRQLMASQFGLESLGSPALAFSAPTGSTVGTAFSSLGSGLSTLALLMQLFGKK